MKRRIIELLVLMALATLAGRAVVPVAPAYPVGRYVSVME